LIEHDDNQVLDVAKAKAIDVKPDGEIIYVRGKHYKWDIEIAMRMRAQVKSYSQIALAFGMSEEEVRDRMLGGIDHLLKES
jgi:hypothetical protein